MNRIASVGIGMALVCGPSLCLGEPADVAKEVRPAIVFVCGHPDDTEGFAGTAFLLGEKYDLHVVDLTTGEGGLGRKGREDGSTARIRRAEEERACAFLGATPHFLGEINFLGECHASKQATDRLVAILEEVRPVALFTHWPVDTHPDHVQAAAVSSLAWACFRNKPKGAQYYFYEVLLSQSRQFPPLYSVDISSTIDKKVEMLRKYACQNQGDELAREKKEQAAFRGRERKPPVPYAEVFTTFDGRPCEFGLLHQLPQAVKVK